MREPTQEEKIAFVEAVVDAAIIQSAECSGLRKWLVQQAVASFTCWQHGNAEEILLHSFEDLTDAFSLIVDPGEMPEEPFSASRAMYVVPSMPWQEG
jgi:hypothetical protein